MVRKLILRGLPEADFTVYLAPEDQSGCYYRYTELALGHFIDKLPQSRYIRVSDKYVAICHLCNETDRNWISLIDQATYQTLRTSDMVIMSSDGTDIPINLHEDLHKIIREWYYNEYESPSALIRRCLRNN
ncbi:hypothetical protein RhiirA1_470471 [Rhizophagus irregularis]|uniref:Uncharacterized protein n=2 Tax=Rhizophagus irregularis TaxID=588596 RepID=A0A2I1F579_9GLOM|nr:hypothetical protein RhiirA1_470471 [Rhizophagus irregularis]PKY29517.1 hypothetical protein RhiirB3_446173 [Rhizophagus irregularis]CAB4473212.1 unnamed protein product [Rhizophagus irregularis]CAB5154433.1 unnamed protein product [Rhizophagus irregularis]CAB5340083.1 unnamed protein product [Rhizophagus irregularis]